MARLSIPRFEIVLDDEAITDDMRINMNKIKYTIIP